MSASSDRATRRELRRAMGEGAISTVAALQRQVEALTAMVNQQTVQIDRLIGVTATDGARLTTLRDMQDRQIAVVRVFLARPFSQRLRWLLTGH
jgi:predicted nucleic acid-binding Zn ribbon protein